MEERKNVYLTLHRKFVHENIIYTDRKTGESKTFHSVTLPKGTIIDGVDVSYYQFSPMFVSPSRFKGENYRDMPLLASREIWLKKGLVNPDGTPVRDENGKEVKDIVKVMPAALKQAVDNSRKEFLASLSDKAKDAREASQNQSRETERPEPVTR
ncbi:DNA gyrase [Adlercreutzia sp. ZJ141]|uniref:DNA gyrase n=1 Tax=Adlercreutzia sp. ZJ141 TaxID=2709406 RepID=UPI0013ED57A8|nr:DNA gyrase [Adlercreutzia sp. ZJ141]